MNLQKCYEEIRRTKSLGKKFNFQKILRKTYLLADLGKHQTRMQELFRFLICI